MTNPNSILRRPHLLKRLGNVGLGVFIIWQLFYLTIANSLETLEVVTHRYPETSESIASALDDSREGNHPTALGGLSSLVFVADKWGQLTEQPQRWSLFAPNIGDQTGFLACELRWNDVEDSAWLLSDNEPQDTTSYFRLAGNRLRSFEQNLAITFALHDGETELAAQERWGHQIQQKLASDYDVLIAWASSRVRDFQREHAGAPMPDEVILHVRGYQIPSPNSQAPADSDTPYSVAFARWIPSAQYPEDALPIEAFNPVTNQFELQPWTTETE